MFPLLKNRIVWLDVNQIRVVLSFKFENNDK